MLTRIQVLIMGIIALTSISFVVFGIWWFFIRRPSQAPQIIQCDTREDPSLSCLSNGIAYKTERQLSTQIPKPDTTLKLTSFTFSPQFAPWCIPSYYAIRYVDNKGNYGEFSDWMGPVVAGINAVPDGCNANTPTFTVTSKSDSNLNKYTVNIHRQDGEWNKKSEGEIVGMLYPKILEFIDDPSTNPNSKYTVFPCGEECQTQSS